MKKLILSLSCLALLVSACNSEKKEANATDSPKVEVSKNVDTAAMNKAWAAYMTPGEAHKMLAKADGKWDAEITFYMGAESSVNKAICETEMILGDRYQQSEYEGDVDGMPFKGINTMAYDNSRKVYISTWIDNMGTGLMYLEGTFDDKTMTLNSKGKATDVATGKEIMIRETMKIIDDKTQYMEMFDTKDGEPEVKTMSIMLKKR